MSETVQFREVQRRESNVTVETWWEYRTRGLLIDGADIILSEWGPWTRFGAIVVDQDGRPL